MRKRFTSMALLVGLLIFLVSSVNALTKGIYITQSTLENTKLITYLIENAKKVGITTFVVDMDKPSKRYQQNIALLKQNNIIYVARVVVFPGGATPDLMHSMSYREKKYALVQTAVNYGANQIQLDYIRYNTKQPPSSHNAEDVLAVIQWFKDKLAAQNIPLQIDVFGIASFGESRYIGHNIPLFAKTVDVLCPMVYPSHYEPFREHAVTPYETVLTSLKHVRKQFNNNTPFKLNPYIELSNYRYPLSHEKKMKYIYAQIQAVQDSGADGWYAWSPHNYYDLLFKVMAAYPVK
ncbi:hypothetical protein AYO45_06310 [Gammaproteobacteria bacterium SCGC AG-212-F23]|nr:hypothetical protein AYO45_06310 [Gammaproteobacteria bacterium SCGC AG-212-F23]